jgi:hypothetical protein
MNKEIHKIGQNRSKNTLKRVNFYLSDVWKSAFLVFKYIKLSKYLSEAFISLKLVSFKKKKEVKN